MHDKRWRDLFKLAGRQEMTFSSQQAVACGIPAKTLHRAGPRLGCHSPWKGVWVVGGSRNTYRRKLWVVRHALGADVVFTGRTVLFLRQIITATPTGIDVWSGRQVHHRDRNGVVFHRGLWVPEDAVARIDGFATAPVRRAFADVARIAAFDSLLRWLPAADRRRLLTLDQLDEYLPHRGAFPGLVNLRAAMAALRHDFPHSGGERLARRLVRAGGLRPYPRPYSVRVDGVTIAEIDLAFVPQKYGAEVDGPHHELPEVVAADKARDRRLRGLGWRIDRFPIREIEADPEGFIAEVKRGLTGA
jgi:hypothetical protein